MKLLSRLYRASYGNMVSIFLSSLTPVHHVVYALPAPVILSECLLP